jgi:hypothetical protein
MAKTKAVDMGNMVVNVECCDEEESRYTSPRSPTNHEYARSHAELAGRKSPPLSAGVSFTEELDATEPLLFPVIDKRAY